MGDAVRACEGKDGRDGWYQNLLLSLASEAQLHCLELLEADNKQQISRSAWAARNLLELHYWVHYVLLSREHARRFHEDAVCDYRDLLGLLNKIPGTESILYMGESKLAELAADMEQMKEGDRYLKIAHLAKQFGEEDQYRVVNKFLSKFVHPTSIAVQLRLNETVRSLIVRVIVDIGAGIMGLFFPLLTRELQKL